MYNSAVPDEGSLERFHPLMLHNILDAVRRFEPDFYAHLCRTYHLDADRILGLFSEIEQLGPGQLTPVLAELREHHSYHDIVYLAGRNALHMRLQQLGMALDRSHGGPPRFATMLKELLPAFTGSATFSHMVRGEMHFVDMRGSLFARGVQQARPVCGFYAGYMSELGATCVTGARGVTEVRCCAVDPDATTCLFQVNL